MKVLEIRLVTYETTADEELHDIARIIEKELPLTGIDVRDFRFKVTSGNPAVANQVM